MKKLLKNLISKCDKIYINGFIANNEDIDYLLTFNGVKFNVVQFSKTNNILKLGVI